MRSTHTTKSSRLIHSAAIAVAIAMVALLGLPAYGSQLDENVAFEIPAQPLESALFELSKQSAYQIVFSSGALPNHSIQAVSGKMQVRQALNRILAGTQLGYKLIGERTITVGPAKPIAEVAAVGPDIRLAQSDSSQTQSSTESQNNSDKSNNSNSSSETSSSDEVEASSKAIPEILVKGSRSLNMDIRRTEDDALPYVVFDSKEIEKSGAANLEDFFRTRLPMNTQQAQNSQQSNLVTDTNNTSQINLRGLGLDETLILVDGRRQPRLLKIGAIGSVTDFSQTDINGIPLAAIERIEILASTAGAIYGGGATGGVINIIRKRAYSGLDVRAGYEGTFRGGGETFRAEISGGFSPDHGKTQIGFSGFHAVSEPLYAGDNDLWRRARELYRRVGSNNNPPYGYTPNIIAQSTLVSVPVGTPGSTCAGNSCFIRQIPNLVLDNGTPLNASFASVPVGYAGPGAGGTNDGGAALIATAGQYALGLSEDLNGRYARLRNNPRVRSGSINVRRALGSKIDTFADFTTSENLGRSIFFGAFPSASMTANDLNNPFRQAITVRIPAPGVGAPLVNRALSLTANAGLIVRLGSDWMATAEYDWGRSRTSTSYTTPVLTTAVSSAYRGNSAFNPLRDVNVFPIDYSNFLTAGPNGFSGPVTTTQQLESARLSGTLVELPGGRVAVTTLLEHQDEIASEYREANPNSAMIFPRRSQGVSSGYLEVRVPVVSGRNPLPLIAGFELQASMRHDRYRTRVASPSFYFLDSPPASVDFSVSQVDATSYTLSARWVPVHDLAFRSSYATGFLPPNIGQLVQTVDPNTTSTSIVDPRRNNTVISETFTLIGGGSPDLEPENSKSFSLGAILSPRLLPGFRFSVDYSRIRKSSEIGASPLDVDALETYFPARVVRGALTQDDRDAGFTVGRILVLNRSLINVAHSTVKALDFQADYNFETAHLGSFRLHALATWQTTYLRQLRPTTTAFDSIGKLDGPLEWRGNAGADWSVGRWNLSWNTQYFDNYSLRSADLNLSAADTLRVTRQGTDRIPSQAYHDLNIGYRFGPNAPALLAGVDLSAGIQNVFDNAPPVIATLDAIGTYSAYGDSRLRRYTLVLSRNFGGN